MVIDNRKPQHETITCTDKTAVTEPVYYEIIIKGYIDKQRSVFFKQMIIRHLPTGETSIAGYVKDPVELYSILTLIRDMGIPLVRVEQIEKKQPIPG